MGRAESSGVRRGGFCFISLAESRGSAPSLREVRAAAPGWLEGVLLIGVGFERRLGN